jgi:hypothetical protein
MTLTATNTSTDLLDILKGMTVAQQNIIRQGYDAYTNRRLCFFVKWPASKADAQSLIPEYVQEIAPGQFQLTDLGVNLYRAWLHQPAARPGADKQPAGYHGTRHSRNWVVRDMFEQKLPVAAINAEPTTEPAVVEVSEIFQPPAAATEPTHESGKVSEHFTALVPPTPPQPPVPPTPAAVVQLDLTAFMQPLLAQIAALEAKLAAATQPTPQPRPVARRKSNAAMPMTVLV